MSSEERGLVRSQRMENGHNSQLVFQEETLRFNCGPPPQRRVGDPGPKTRELTGFIDDKMFSVDRDRYFAPQTVEFRRALYGGDPLDPRDPSNGLNWNRNGNAGARTPSGDGSDEDEDEDEDDDDDEVDEGDGEVEGLVCVHDASKGNTNDNNNSSSSGHSGADKMGNGNGKPKHHSSFVGSNREALAKDGVVGPLLKNIGASPSENHQHGRLSNYQNAVTIAEPDGDLYYSQYLQGTDGSAPIQKDLVGENCCGFSGRKDASFPSESGESLKAILSDPVTGALMDDAMILPCGHSFGSGGIQHVIRVKACYTCSQSVSEDSIAPNLSLRAAVQAFCREEELQFYRSSKRKRERFDQEKCGYGDSALMDPSRGRGVQFPFVVTDRVIIKGNKRTPQRFVGREAIVTTQCLNGWYVVKTLDNAESVKLQYRSLAKVPDDPCAKLVSSKMAPNWL